MNDEKNKETKKPVNTFRDGAAGASVWLKQSSQGFYYYDMSLSRSWKNVNGKAGYSQNFFSGNRDQLHNVVDQACDFIDEQNENAETVVIDATEPTDAEAA